MKLSDADCARFVVLTKKPPDKVTAGERAELAALRTRSIEGAPAVPGFDREGKPVDLETVRRALSKKGPGGE